LCKRNLRLQSLEPAILLALAVNYEEFALLILLDGCVPIGLPKRKFSQRHMTIKLLSREMQLKRYKLALLNSSFGIMPFTQNRKHIAKTAKQTHLLVRVAYLDSALKTLGKILPGLIELIKIIVRPANIKRSNRQHSPATDLFVDLHCLKAIAN